MRAIPAAFDARAGHGSGPDLDELRKLLRDMRRLVVLHAPDAPAPDARPGRRPAAGADEAAAPGVPAPARGGGMSVASLGAIGSRADALRLMDLVVEYFERHEPGSPLPLLIGRARRLADKDFLDLLRDLAPDGLNQAEVVVGRRPE